VADVLNKETVLQDIMCNIFCYREKIQENKMIGLQSRDIEGWKAGGRKRIQTDSTSHNL